MLLKNVKSTLGETFAWPLSYILQHGVLETVTYICQHRKAYITALSHLHTVYTSAGLEYELV